MSCADSHSFILIQLGLHKRCDNQLLAPLHAINIFDLSLSERHTCTLKIMGPSIHSLDHYLHRSQTLGFQVGFHVVMDGSESAVPVTFNTSVQGLHQSCSAPIAEIICSAVQTSLSRQWQPDRRSESLFSNHALDDSEASSRV